MANSSKGSVMRSAALNTNSPFRTRPKHVKLTPCPIEISPQHRTNSLDANVARRGILQHAEAGPCGLTTKHIHNTCQKKQAGFLEK